MTERHDEAAATGRSMSTGEFRAAPDISASTAQFQAFAENRAEPASPREVVAPARKPTRLIALMAAAVVVLLILVIIVAKVA
jgi:hypothetical protein